MNSLSYSSSSSVTHMFSSTSAAMGLQFLAVMEQTAVEASTKGFFVLVVEE